MTPPTQALPPLLAVMLASAPARATSWYVSETGSDAAAGTETAPWGTLQHAADRVAPGDIVTVAAGSYAGFDLRTSGTHTAPITFSAQPGATIDRDNSTTTDGINLEAASWIVVEGFEVVGVTRAGIRAVLCEHVTIRANRTDQNGRWGIFTGFCDDLLLEDNECSRSGDEHGIYLSNSGDRPTVRGNLLWGNAGCGLHMNGDLSMGGDGLISQALIEQNIIWNNGDPTGGSGINCDGVQDSIIRNNLLFDNHASGISLYRTDGAEGSKRNLVINNTVINADDGRWALNIQSGSTDTTALNNLLYSHHSWRGAVDVSTDSLDGLVCDHNAVEDRFTLDGGDSVLTLAEWQAATGQDAQSISGEPAAWLVNPQGEDHHLAEGSAAVDAGTDDQAPSTDLAGDPRPCGEGWDIGAYELQQDCEEPFDTDVPDDSDPPDDTQPPPDSAPPDDTQPPSDSDPSDSGRLETDDKGCACTGSRAVAAWWLVPLLAVGSALRRRRAR